MQRCHHINRCGYPQEAYKTRGFFSIGRTKSKSTLVGHLAKSSSSANFLIGRGTGKPEFKIVIFISEPWTFFSRKECKNAFSASSGESRYRIC